MKNAFLHARAGLLALAILLLGSVFVASPASAHQGDITAAGECQPNGTYLVTYTLSWTSVPEAAYGTRILTREDSDAAFDNGWEQNPGAYQWTDRGEITSPQGSISWTDTLPGTTAGPGLWEYAWLDWSNGNTSNTFHDTRIEDLGGDCADTTEPTHVRVGATFGDNVCVDNVYTEPTLDAPEYEGTTREVTGTVAPGETVTVTYTALENVVIDGPSTFTHDYPATPASSTDCEKEDRPEPIVRDRSQTRTDCEGVETRSWEVVREYTWNGEEWVLSAPEVRNDTGWVFVRALTEKEQRQLGCLEVAGEQETPPDEEDQEQEVAPTAAATTSPATAPAAVPTAVDAGLTGEQSLATAGPGWLAPLLGGVIVIGLAAFSRLKALGQQG